MTRYEKLNVNKVGTLTATFSNEPPGTSATTAPLNVKDDRNPYNCSYDKCNCRSRENYRKCFLNYNYSLPPTKK